MNDRDPSDGQEPELRSGSSIFRYAVGALLVGSLLAAGVGIALWGGGVPGVGDTTQQQAGETEYQLPAGATEGGLDARTITTSHTRVLSNSTYTVRATFNVTEGGDRTTTSRVYQHSQSRKYLKTAAENRTIERYFDRENGTGFRRVTRNTGTTDYEPIGRVERFTGERLVNQRLQGVETSYEGTKTTASGDVVGVFRVQGVTDGIKESSDESFTASGEVHVAADGHIPYFRLVTDFEGERQQVFTYRVTDLGETTIDRPGWYFDALDALPQ